MRKVAIFLTIVGLFILFAVAAVTLRFTNAATLQTIEIQNVTKPQTIILKKRFFQGSVESMQIEGSGTLDGKARIQRILDGGSGPYDDEQISGNVYFRWNDDWYSDTAEIRYIPQDVKGGHLKLTYRFGSL